MLAEAQHEVTRTRTCHNLEALDIRGPTFVAENVEQAAVEHRIDLLADGGQVERVVAQEANVQPALAVFAFGDFDGRGRTVDADGFKAALNNPGGALSGFGRRLVPGLVIAMVRVVLPGGGSVPEACLARPKSRIPTWPSRSARPRSTPSPDSSGHRVPGAGGL